MASVLSSVVAEDLKSGVMVGMGHCSMKGFRPTMEDAVVIEKNYLITSSSSSERVLRRMALFAVFDGHGGGECADYLAKNTPRVLATHLRRDGGRAEVGRCLEDAVAELDDLCIEHSADGSGSTGVIVLIDKQLCALWVANVGDSRCILISSAGVAQLSVEHKPSDAGERKRIEEAKGWVTSGRVLGILAVSRSFGDRDFKRHSEELVISKPSITKRKLTASDQYLVVACDGLWDVFSNEEVSKFILFSKEEFPDLTLHQLATDIVTDAIHNRRSRDNVSAILVKLYVSDVGPVVASDIEDVSATASVSSASMPTAAATSSAAAASAISSVPLVSDSTDFDGSAPAAASSRVPVPLRRSREEASSEDAGEYMDSTTAIVGLDIAPSAIGGVVRGGRR